MRPRYFKGNETHVETSESGGDGVTPWSLCTCVHWPAGAGPGLS